MEAVLKSHSYFLTLPKICCLASWLLFLRKICRSLHHNSSQALMLASDRADDTNVCALPSRMDKRYIWSIPSWLERALRKTFVPISLIMKDCRPHTGDTELWRVMPNSISNRECQLAEWQLTQPSSLDHISSKKKKKQKEKKKETLYNCLGYTPPFLFCQMKAK